MSLVTEIDNFAATTNHPTPSSEIRFDWTRSEILELLDQSFSDLLFQAHLALEKGEKKSASAILDAALQGGRRRPGASRYS